MKINKESILKELVDNKMHFLYSSLIFMGFAFLDLLEYHREHVSLKDMHASSARNALIVAILSLLLHLYLNHYEKKYYPKKNLN